MKLSVALISFNEEQNIVRTLAAIKNIADEIVVVDSFSTDRTVELAKSFGAKVFIEEWKGYIAQENAVLDKCSGEWVLFIDCDEVATPELINSIKKAINSDKYQGYILSRRSFYMGKLLNHAWRPDRKLRLIKRASGVRWTGQDPHLILKMNTPQGFLKGDLIHYSYKNFDHHMQRTIQQSVYWAKARAKNGKTITAFTVITRPLFAFFKELILKLAILDGIRGIIAAQSSAMASYTKYTYLWELQNAEEIMSKTKKAQSKQAE